MSVVHPSGLTSFQLAELLEVHGLGDSRVIAADRAIRVAPIAYFVEPHGQQNVHQRALN